MNASFGQVVALCTPSEAPTDAVKFRFRFYIAANSGSVHANPKIKMLFATFRLWNGTPGAPALYMIESNLYTRRWTYMDPTFPPPGPPVGLQGQETYDEASIRIAVPDYVGSGLTGCKTFSPLMFPRQTYQIDYIAGLWKTDMMSQTNLNDTEGFVEIERGSIVDDKTGWKYNGSLASDVVFRQWNASVTFRNARYDTALAVPDDGARFLCQNEMPTLGSEFFANWNVPGLLLGFRISTRRAILLGAG